MYTKLIYVWCVYMLSIIILFGFMEFAKIKNGSASFLSEITDTPSYKVTLQKL